MYERFFELLKESGKKPADVSKATGLSPTLFSEWKKGKWTPSAEKLYKIAQYFHVTMEYFVTGERNSTTGGYPITPTEYQIILAYRKADTFDKITIDRTLHLEDMKKEASFTA